MWAARKPPPSTSAKDTAYSNATCLSMLYDQNINAILELCPLTIIPQKEVIIQIPANTWSSLPNLSPVIWKA
jgi:hypothetical protein